MSLKNTFYTLLIPMVLLLASCAETSLFSDPVSADDDSYAPQAVPEDDTYVRSS